MNEPRDQAITEHDVAERLGLSVATLRAWRRAELASRPIEPARRRQAFGSLTVSDAIARYAQDRRAQVSRRMRKYWIENGRRLAEFFGERKLRQNAR